MKYILENLQLYYPFLYDDAEDFIQVAFDEIVIRHGDGKVFLYDNTNKTFRRIPSSDENITEEDFKREFGYKLRKVMYLKNVTQDELSIRTEIPQSVLSRYISGTNMPSFYKVYKIAKALECSMDELTCIL